MILPEREDVDGWSLFPPLAAILVAISCRNLILGLSTAIVGAAALTTRSTSILAAPFEVLERAIVDFVWVPVSDSFQIYILLFTVGLIGMVRVIALAGGTEGIAAALARRARGTRSARLATFLLGLAIFFDDYANTMVVGTTMRPVADRFRISREKLAYIVDSTAAPVAGIAIISTWIGYEVGLFDEIMKSLGAGISGYELFFRAIPSRFYCFLALTFVATSILINRDFGPMLRAEERALREGNPELEADAIHQSAELDAGETAAGVCPSAVTAIVPVVVIILGVIVGVQLDTWTHTDVVQARYDYTLVSHRYWTVAFSSANTAKVMFLSSMAGIAVAVAFAFTRKDGDGRRLLPFNVIASAWLGGRHGLNRIAMIVVLLSLAWAIKEACEAVDTSTYLLAILRTSLAPGSLPLVTFLLASLISFSIGTSWATMAILLPTVLPVAYELGEIALVVPVAAAVLDGAIFGDHCSPISDTTVLSSIACECDLVDHVKTQLPYAAAAMFMAASFGYLGSSYLYPAHVGLALGIGAVVGVVVLFGKRAGASTTE
jgi:Na+/H+ antiporter NhaC